jgi:hypothetical protein
VFRRTARFLVLLAALAGVAGAAAGRAAADDVAPAACATVAPAATLTLSAGKASVQTYSNGGSYAFGLCPLFVADINVPTSTGAPSYWPGFFVGGGYNGPVNGPSLGGLPLSRVECELFVGYLQVYRRSMLGGDFHVLGGGMLYGVWSSGGWVEPHFKLTKAAAYDELPLFSPPALFGAVYRVAVGMQIVGTPHWRMVNVRAWHPLIVS